MKKKGLGGKIKKLFKIKTGNEDFFNELEDILVEGDLGALLAMETVDYLRGLKITDTTVLREELSSHLGSFLISDHFKPDPEKMNVYLVLGVNGVGKTTTIAKFVNMISSDIPKDKIFLGAGDTFRAAAIDQLQTHGERLGVKVISQKPGADPGAVIYDTIESAAAKNGKVVIADTAGRLHNKANLIKELEKINKIISKKAGDAVYKKILIIDATTGQNGLRQAEIFNEAIGVDAIILSKYDSAAKGGTIVAINKQLQIPIAYVGIGEKYTDIIPFNSNEYLDNLLGN